MKPNRVKKTEQLVDVLLSSAPFLYFEVVKTPKKDKKSMGRVRLLDASGFPGVIVEFTDFKPKNEKAKSTDFLLTYKVIKAPKEYKNLDDSRRNDFDSIIKTIFKAILETIITEKRAAKNER